MKITIDVPECECGCGEPVKVSIWKYVNRTHAYRVYQNNLIIKKARELIAEKKGLDKPEETGV